MPTYKVTDPVTNKTLRLTGDSPPTEEELTQIFAQYGGAEIKAEPVTAPPPPPPQTVEEQTGVPRWGRENPNRYGVYGAGKELINKAVKPTLETVGAIGGSLGSPIVGTALGYGAGKKAGEFLETQYGKLENPEIKTKSLGQEMIGSAEDVGGAMLLGKGMDTAGNLIFKTEEIPGQLTQAIRKGIEKSIRPSVEGQRTFPQMNKYLDRAETAVKAIIQEKPNLKLTTESGETHAGLPQTLKQFSQAIDQTKKTVFQKYDALASTSEKQGGMVDLAPIAKELKKVSGNKVVSDLNPNIANYADDLANRFTERGTYTTSEAQEAIATMNNNLEAFYKNPSYENASRVSIDAMVANRMRRSLDKVIEQTTGEGYQELKNVYGALSTIERDVNRRAIVDARKNIKGLIDFSDIFSGSEVIHGILNLNPATIGAGVAAKGIASWIKYLNNPNRIVKNMFEDAEKIVSKLPKTEPVLREPVELLGEGAIRVKPPLLLEQPRQPQLMAPESRLLLPEGPIRLPGRRVYPWEKEQFD